MHTYNTAQRSRGLSCFRLRGICLLLCGFALIVAIAQPAFAHKVNIFAYTEGNTVFTESYFNDGKKCVNSLITVFDNQGNKLLEGTTDKDGIFSFEIPRHTDLKIVLTASMGHRAEYVFKKSELSGSVSETEPDAPDIPPSRIPKQEQEKTTMDNVDMAQLQSLIEQSLDKKLAPIKKMIAKNRMEQGPSLVEVIGGIGYIFGIMGLAIFFKNKRNE